MIRDTASFYPGQGPNPLRLSCVRLADGSTGDVILKDGRIAAVTKALNAPADLATVDLTGYILLPSLVEPHCHFDKIFTDSLINAPAGDVAAASAAWHSFRRTIDFDAVAARAEAAIETLIGNGVTAIRTHVDVGRDSGARLVTTLAALRGRLREQIDLQIVAFVDNPLAGDEGAGNRRILAESLDVGADVIGGAPYQNPDPRSFLETCLELGQRHGCGIDLHMDETTDASVFTLPHLISMIRRTGFAHPVAASHCVSLGMQKVATIGEMSEALAEAGVSIVALPLCNLFLQGRTDISGKPRGLAPLATLIDAGVTVTAGGDNYQDPFNPVGRLDPLEIASLLVTAGHLSPEAAFECVTTSARRAVGLPTVKIAAGYPADLLAIRAGSLREAIATASAERMVFRSGRLIAATRLHRSRQFGTDFGRP